MSPPSLSVRRKGKRMNELDIEFLKEVLGQLVRANGWLDQSRLINITGCESKDVQAALGVLFRGAFVVREQKEGKAWWYRINPDLQVEHIERLANSAITVEDLLSLSPVPQADRQAFKYQRKSEAVAIREAIDAAKRKGDIQLENLEGLAIASAEAYEKYVEGLSKNDKTLNSLRQMSKGCEHAFWTYAKGLPRG
jgi:hypothetical protein